MSCVTLQGKTLGSRCLGSPELGTMWFFFPYFVLYPFTIINHIHKYNYIAKSYWVLNLGVVLGTPNTVTTKNVSGYSLGNTGLYCLNFHKHEKQRLNEGGWRDMTIKHNTSSWQDLEIKERKKLFLNKCMDWSAAPMSTSWFGRL